MLLLPLIINVCLSACPADSGVPESLADSTEPLEIPAVR